MSGAAKTSTRSFKKYLGRTLMAILLSSTSMASAADPSAIPPQQPVHKINHAAVNECLPEFVMPTPSPGYGDLLSSPTPPAPIPQNDLAASPANVVPQSAAPTYNFGGNVQGSSLLASSFVPAMVGDLLNPGGAVGTSITRNVTATGTVPIADFLTAFNPLPDDGSATPWSPTLSGSPSQFVVSGLPGFTYNESVSGLNFTTVQYQNVLFNPSSGIDLDQLFPNPNGPNDPGPVNIAYLTANISKFQNIAVVNSSQVQQVVENAGAATPNGFVSNIQPSPGTNNGTVGVQTDGTQNGTNGVGTWDYTLEYIPIIVPNTIPQQVASLIPAGGSVASAPSISLGRQKLAENSSPIPRDRVFVNYNYFNNTPLYRGGVDVNRVTPGFEKTFFNNRASFELRAPFATTLDSTVELNGITNTHNAEIGNLTMYLKGLLFANETFAVSTGLGITAPTADDFVVQNGNSNLLLVQNDSVHLLPFLAGTFTPNDRFFAQAMMQVDVDANGNPVSVSQFDGTNFTGNLSSIGRGYDYTYMYLDFNAGYWVYQNPGSGRFITGLAPITELHINQTVGGASDVSGTVDTVNWAFNSNGAITQVNSLFGVTAIVRDTSTLTLAYCTPLSSERAFSGEFRLNFNWYFGNSRPTNRLMRTPTF